MKNGQNSMREKLQNGLNPTRSWPFLARSWLDLGLSFSALRGGDPIPDPPISIFGK